MYPCEMCGMYCTPEDALTNEDMTMFWHKLCLRLVIFNHFSNYPEDADAFVADLQESG